LKNQIGKGILHKKVKEDIRKKYQLSLKKVEYEKY